MPSNVTSQFALDHVCYEIGRLPGSFAILTTTPNDLVAPIHNRMPVILTAESVPSR